MRNNLHGKTEKPIPEGCRNQIFDASVNNDAGGRVSTLSALHHPFSEYLDYS
jgi:hypothetical protein